ncbi:hypothetical protein ABPG74_003738 [Tetrahymena malaccensis]
MNKQYVGEVTQDSQRWPRQPQQQQQQQQQSQLVQQQIQQQALQQQSQQQLLQQQQQQQMQMLEQKENFSAQFMAYQGQQQAQFLQQASQQQLSQQPNFSQTQQQPLSYRLNTDQSKSPRRDKVGLSRSQSGGNYQPQLDTFYLTGWGNSKCGQLSASKFTNNAIQAFGNRVISVSAGENHTMIIDHKQELYACGSNAYGQLGIEGVSYLNKPTPIPGLKDVKISMVSCGSDHTFALTTQGEVYAWGLNLKGQLGLGNFENQFSPVLVYSLLPLGQNNKRAKKKTNENENDPNSQHKRLKSANELRGQGEDQSPGLKDRSNSIENMMEQLNRIKLSEKTNKPKNNSNSGSHGSVNFAGSDISTQIQLSNDEIVSYIACGTLHTVVVTSKNRLFSCGYGETYALGHGDKSTLNEFKLIQTIKSQQQQYGMNRGALDASPRLEKIEKLSCGLSHTTCVIGGRAYVWGYCGQRDSLIYQYPTEMDFQQGQTTQNVSSNIIDTRAGDCFTLFLNNKGDVYALGENTEGQLCSEYNSPYEIPQRINSLPSISQIAVGKNYCLVISRDLKYIFGWGSNAFGQITGRLTSSPVLCQPVKVQTINPENKDIKLICGSYHTIMLSSKSLTGNEFILKEDEQPVYSKDLKLDSGDNVGNELEKIKKQSQIESDKYQKLIEEKQNEIEALKKCNMNLIKNQEKNARDIKDLKLREHEFQKQLKEAKQRAEQAMALANNQIGTNNNNQQQMNELSKFQIKGIDKYKNLNFRMFNSNLDIDFNELTTEAKISEGGYGIIYKAKWRETTVAVKKFKMVHDENTVRDFLSECHAMEALRHPNIVMFLGACTKSPNFCIILEYCQKGSLWGLLQSDVKLSWEDRRRIALDAARGVHYLHSSNPPILHRDLKSLNLLLDDNLRCKLADFGWTRVKDDNYMTAKIGTYQWMAPEVISSNIYTEKADVFSYGIILWEIASREPPYRNKTGSTVSVEVVKNNLRPIIPKNCPPQFADLMQRCWDNNQSLRPSFNEIIKELEKMNFSKTP